MRLGEARRSDGEAQSDITSNGWPLGHKCRIALRQSDLQLFVPIAGAADDQRARGTVTPMRVSRVTSFASSSSSMPSVPVGLIGSTM